MVSSFCFMLCSSRNDLIKEDRTFGLVIRLQVVSTIYSKLLASNQKHLVERAILDVPSSKCRCPDQYLVLDQRFLTEKCKPEKRPVKGLQLKSPS